jgi:acyl-CoA thioesterase-1
VTRLQTCYRHNAFSAGALLAACLLLSACQPAGSLSPLSQQARVLAFGDSLTYGYGVGSDYAYPAVLSKLIDREVLNAGISGELSAEGLERLPGLLDRWRPELVIICHGGNDILRRMNSEQTERNLRKMISMARDRGIGVVVIAVPTFGLFPKAAAYYEGIAEDAQVPVEMDILAALVSDNSKKSDQVHFNQAGYREMAEAVLNLLSKEGAI